MARLGVAQPQLFVADVTASAAWFARVLGFETVYLYGTPPYYGLVRRDSALLNLRHVDTSPWRDGRRDAEELLSAWIEVADIVALHDAMLAAGADIAVPPQPKPWGHTEFIVRDPDGNLICFSGNA